MYKPSPAAALVCILLMATAPEPVAAVDLASTLNTVNTVSGIAMGVAGGTLGGLGSLGGRAVRTLFPFSSVPSSSLSDRSSNSYPQPQYRHHDSSSSPTKNKNKNKDQNKNKSNNNSGKGKGKQQQQQHHHPKNGQHGAAAEEEYTEADIDVRQCLTLAATNSHGDCSGTPELVMCHRTEECVNVVPDAIQTGGAAADHDDAHHNHHQQRRGGAKGNNGNKNTKNKNKNKNHEDAEQGPMPSFHAYRLWRSDCEIRSFSGVDCKGDVAHTLTAGRGVFNQCYRLGFEARSYSVSCPP